MEQNGTVRQDNNSTTSQQNNNTSQQDTSQQDTNIGPQHENRTERSACQEQGDGDEGCEMIIEEYTPAFLWKHNFNESRCMICFNDMNGICSSCETKVEEDQSLGRWSHVIRCPVSRGECGHVMHKHCLDAWRGGGTAGAAVSCPYCRNEFKVVRTE